MFAKFAAVLLAATVVAAPAFAGTTVIKKTSHISAPATVKVVKHARHHRQVVVVKKIKRIHAARHLNRHRSVSVLHARKHVAHTARHGAPVSVKIKTRG
jgi:hypothetical protein